MKSPIFRKTTNKLGVLLRHWRDVRGKSQLDLSLDTGVSQKQISFVESGRSVPSRFTLTAIAGALDIPLRDRNTLLLAAGYAPIFSDGPWNSVEMKSVTNALKRILRQHEPFPALVMDRYWNVLMTNECAPRFFNCFIDMAAREGPRNMLHLMFDPKGLRPFIANWEDLAKGLFERVYREVGRARRGREDQGIDRGIAGLSRCEQRVEKSRGLELHARDPHELCEGRSLLNYFSMVTTVGTPQTVAAQELRIESCSRRISRPRPATLH